jgi:hypothetical protein
MTGPVVDLLNAVDWVVPDRRAAYTRVTELLPELEPTGEVALPEHDFDSVFLRGPASMAAAPTRLQLVILSEGGAGPHSGCAVAPFAPMQQLQGLGRGQRIHGTVLAVRNFDESIAWLRARSVPVFVERECAHLPYLRAWLGWSPDGLEHVPGVDGGLFVEFIPIEAFPRSVGMAVLRPPEAAPSLRVAGRVHLVEDLDAASAQLADTVGLGAPRRYDDPLLGLRGARWSFRHPGSGDLVVAQPYPTGLAASYLAAHGPGAWLTTLRAADAEATAEAAVARGAVVVASNQDDPPRVVLADEVTGIHLEIEQGSTDVD